MPKRKTYFQCKACQSKHIKPIDTECPFVVSTDEDSASVSHQNMDQSSVNLQENATQTTPVCLDLKESLALIVENNQLKTENEYLKKKIK